MIIVEIDSSNLGKIYKIAYCVINIIYISEFEQEFKQYSFRDVIFLIGLN